MPKPRAALRKLPDTPRVFNLAAHTMSTQHGPQGEANEPEGPEEVCFFLMCKFAPSACVLPMQSKKGEDFVC